MLNTESSKRGFFLTTKIKLLLGILITGVLVFTWWLPYFERSGGVFDESVLLIYPDLILHGRLPYRDFSTYYGPANLWVLAFFYKIFDVSLTSERIVGLAYRFFYLLAIGWLGRKVAPGLSWLFILVGLIVASLLDLEALAWFPGSTIALSSLLIGLSTDNSSPRIRLCTFISGVAAGVALLFRPDLGPAIMLSSVPMLVSWSWINRKTWFLGMILSLIPLALLAWRTSLQALWLNFFYFPVVLGSPGRKIPLGTLSSSQQLLIGLMFLIMALNLITAAHVWRKDKNSRQARLYLAGALLGLGMSHQLFQRCDTLHIAMGILIALPLFIGTLYHWLSFRFLPRIATYILVVLVTISISFFPVFEEIQSKMVFNFKLATGILALNPYNLKSGKRSFLVAPRQKQIDFTRVINVVNMRSHQGQTVYVGQWDLRRSYINDIFIYYLLMPKLRPGCYHIESNPLVGNAKNSGFASQLAKCDWVILNALWDNASEPNRSQELGDARPVAVLASQFTLIQQVGWLSVYQNNRLQDQGGDRPGSKL